MNQTSTLSPNSSTSAVTLAAGRSPARSRTNLLAQAMTRHLRESTNRVEKQIELDAIQIDNLLHKVSEILCQSRADQKPADQVNCEAASSDFTKHLLALKQQIVDSEYHKLLMEKPYRRQILLTTVLPLYLRSSSQSLSNALNHAMQLVWEHRSILALNHLLEGDLISAIDEANEQHQSPIAAAEAVLKMELGTVVAVCRRSIRSKWNSTTSIAHDNSDHPTTSLTPKQRDGYWAIASQWTQQREAISIPADLAVGAVSWPRLKSHWNELSAYLFDEPRSSQSLTRTALERTDAPNDSFKHDTRFTETQQASPTKSSISPTPPFVQSETKNSVSYLSDTIPSCNVAAPIDSHPDIIEIRSANDPELARNLDVHLQRCRERSGSLALVVVRCKADPNSVSASGSKLPTGTLASWQLDIITTLQSSLEHRKMYGFHTSDGEIALIMEDVERTEVTALVRKVLEHEALVDDQDTRLLDQAGLPLYSGIACVHAPSKSFRLAQLTESAWRCLDASMRQPPGAVKSIEVY